MTKKKLAYFISSVAFLGSAALFPASAAEISVTGNGAYSDNTVHLSEQKDKTIHQKNNASITNTVSVDSNTGHNRANANTGGDVSIETGDTHTDVTIINTAGENIAKLGGHHEQKDLEVKVSGNGALSDNKVHLSNNNNTEVVQKNNTEFDNDVNVTSNTGHNHASANTSYNDGDKKYWPKYKYEPKKYEPKHDWKKYDSKYDKKYDDKKKHAFAKYGKADDYFKDKYKNYHPFFHGNQGGDVSIKTGDTHTAVDLVNTAGSNYATL